MMQLPTSKTFGMRIRDLRIQQSMQLDQLAKLSQVSPHFLENVERGIVSMPAEHLVDLAQALKIDPNILIAEFVIEVSNRVYERAGLAKPNWKVVPLC